MQRFASPVPIWIVSLDCCDLRPDFGNGFLKVKSLLMTQPKVWASPKELPQS